MDPLLVPEAIAGGALLFFVPGFAVAKAVFPERRVRGEGGVRWAIELVALALVLSVVLTVVVGYLLLVGAPGGFSASWTNPLLETALAAIALVALFAGWLQGAYARLPPQAAAAAEPGTEGVWELRVELDRLQRERLSLDRELRATPEPQGAIRARLTARREEVVRAEETLRRGRDAEYDL